MLSKYDGFADYLTGQGLVVFGHDHLGHGGSVQRQADWGHFADRDGDRIVLDDIRQLTRLARQQYPGLPLVLFGHSMGSFFTRCFLSAYGDEIDGAILSGTGQQSLLELTFGQALTTVIRATRGARYRSKLVDDLAFANLNKAFAGGRTTRDWLTRDEAIVDFHLSDPRCNFMFTVTAYRDMFRCYQNAQDPVQVEKIPKDKPVLILAGDQDPVSGFGQGASKAHDQLKQAGLQRTQLKLYPVYRHEILNEIGREEVYEDIMRWIRTQVR
jgi:alpha-beta hydrolase superfamily lysophospholipase